MCQEHSPRPRTGRQRLRCRLLRPRLRCRLLCPHCPLPRHRRRHLQPHHRRRKTHHHHCRRHPGSRHRFAAEASAKHCGVKALMAVLPAGTRAASDLTILHVHAGPTVTATRAPGTGACRPPRHACVQGPLHRPAPRPDRPGHPGRHRPRRDRPGHHPLDAPTRELKTTSHGL